jgi:hypothetical protein
MSCSRRQEKDFQVRLGEVFRVGKEVSWRTQVLSTPRAWGLWGAPALPYPQDQALAPIPCLTSSQAPGFQTRPHFSLLFYLSIKSLVHDSQVGAPLGQPPPEHLTKESPFLPCHIWQPSPPCDPSHTHTQCSLPPLHLSLASGPGPDSLQE